MKILVLNLYEKRFFSNYLKLTASRFINKSLQFLYNIFGTLTLFFVVRQKIVQKKKKKVEDAVQKQTLIFEIH